MPTATTVPNSSGATNREPRKSAGGSAGPKRRSRKQSDRRWLEKRRVKCANYAEENTVLAKRGAMLMCWAIVADATGAEAERHLRALDRRFVEFVYSAAWGIDADGVQHRSWGDWRARAIAAVAVFLAFNCMPSELHGRQVWRVAGFTMNFFRMLVSFHRVRDGSGCGTCPAARRSGTSAERRTPQLAPADGWVTL